MNAPCRRAESFRRISAAEGFHRPRRLVKNTFSPALLWSRVDGVARGVYFCHGTGGNEGCRKASPCSIWARPACIHGRLACATSRWRSIGPADTRSRLRFARKTPRSHSVPSPCRMTMRRGGTLQARWRSRSRRLISTPRLNDALRKKSSCIEIPNGILPSFLCLKSPNIGVS